MFTSHHAVHEGRHAVPVAQGHTGPPTVEGGNGVIPQGLALHGLGVAAHNGQQLRRLGSAGVVARSLEGPLGAAEAHRHEAANAIVREAPHQGLHEPGGAHRQAARVFAVVPARRAP